MATRFIKRGRKRREDGEDSWGYGGGFQAEEHSMWKGLKEALKRKVGLC